MRSFCLFVFYIGNYWIIHCTIGFKLSIAICSREVTVPLVCCHLEFCVLSVCSGAWGSTVQGVRECPEKGHQGGGSSQGQDLQAAAEVT